jgi:hypothetical protein
MESATYTLIDLSHTIEAGMTTFKGLPGPVICDYWSREDSRANYDDGSTFQIGRIDMSTVHSIATRMAAILQAWLWNRSPICRRS